MSDDNKGAEVIYLDMVREARKTGEKQFAEATPEAVAAMALSMGVMMHAISLDEDVPEPTRKLLRDAAQLVEDWLGDGEPECPRRGA